MTPATRYIIPSLGGFYDRFSGLAEPLIRVIIGLMLMPHGAQKLFGWFGGGGIAGTGGFFSNLGIEPGQFWAVVVGCVELFGGALLALGLFTRLIAAAVIVEMLVAIIAFHLSKGYFAATSGIEFPLMWGLIAIAFVLRGGGKYSIDARIGREF